MYLTAKKKKIFFFERSFEKRFEKKIYSVILSKVNWERKLRVSLFGKFTKIYYFNEMFTTISN